jgi:diphosphomevalonate decarboxylase
MAVLERDFEVLAEVVELDCHLMHAVMMTSNPPLIYWAPASIAVIQAVRAWRAAGTAACYTLDAGPNVHVICMEDEAERVAKELERIPGVMQVLLSGVGGQAHLVEAVS